MQKQSECPEECREAVSSLMFAAARFADLPELRVLRQMFTERYGDSLELFKNQEGARKGSINQLCIQQVALTSQHMLALDANTQMLGVLLVASLLATILILSLGYQKEKIQQKNTVEVNPGPGKEIKIDILTTVLSSALPHDNPQVQILEKNSCLNGLPRELKYKMASNSNALVLDQTNVDTSDGASLLHQTPFETSSFHTQRDLLPEEQQTSLGVANDDSARLPSLTSQQQSPPDANTHSRAQIPCLKIELKVRAWVSMISAGGIVSVLSGLVGNETAMLTHKILFQAFTALNYVSLVLGLGVFLLALTRPKIPGLVTIVKVTMWSAFGCITYALACATCLFLPELVEVILVLVAPLVMVCLVVILSFCCRK